MSRFKEQRRIDNAIKHKNSEELEWAYSYVEMRLKNLAMKKHEKHWRKMKKLINQAIQEIE